MADQYAHESEEMAVEQLIHADAPKRARDRAARASREMFFFNLEVCN